MVDPAQQVVTLHFADRYHDHILKSPREVRNALRYVFANGRKHAAEGREVFVPQAIDTFTSAPWFAGFRERITGHGIDAIVRPVTDARNRAAHRGLVAARADHRQKQQHVGEVERRLRRRSTSVHEVPATA